MLIVVIILGALAFFFVRNNNKPKNGAVETEQERKNRIALNIGLIIAGIFTIGIAVVVAMIRNGNRSSGQDIGTDGQPQGSEYTRQPWTSTRNTRPLRSSRSISLRRPCQQQPWFQRLYRGPDTHAVPQRATSSTSRRSVGPTRPTTTSTSLMSWAYDGRSQAAAGFKGNAGDCGTRAVATRYRD